MDSGGGGDRQGQSAWIVVEEVTDRASQHG